MAKIEDYKTNKNELLLQSGLGFHIGCIIK